MRKGVIIGFAVVAGLTATIILVQFNKAQQRRARLGMQPGVSVENVEQVAQKNAFVDGMSAVAVAEWSGKKAGELTKFFPGVPALAGVSSALDIGDTTVANWHGWERLTLAFSDGRLSSATFSSRFSLTEDDAQRILTQKFGLVLPKEKYFKEESERGYENLSGKVSAAVVVSHRKGTGTAPMLWAAAAQKAADANFRTREIVIKFSGR